MKTIKTTAIAAMLFIACSALGQQSEYYQKARDAYLEAASKTKCPETRGRVLKEYAAWNDRMVKVLAGTLASAGAKPTTPVPPCDGDMLGNSSTNAGLGNSANPSSVSLENSMTQDAMAATMSTAYADAINNGRKDSGAMLEASLAAAQSTTDANAGAATLGTGLVLSGIMALMEKKAKKRAARAAEQERLALLSRQREAEDSTIEQKSNLIKSFRDGFFKLDFADTIRRAILIVGPVDLTSDVQDIYFSQPVLVQSNGDGSFPSIGEVKQNIMPSFPTGQFDNDAMSNFLIYPFSGENDLTALSETCRQVNFNPMSFKIAYTNVPPAAAGAESKMGGDGHLDPSGQEKPSTRQ